MAKLKPNPRALSQRIKLTPEEFASLKAVGTRPIQPTIPDEHWDRLIAAGHVREIVRNFGAVSALELTGRRLTRLAAGKWTRAQARSSTRRALRKGQPRIYATAGQIQSKPVDGASGRRNNAGKTEKAPKMVCVGTTVRPREFFY